MSTEKFIDLLKKELLRQATVAEQEELQLMLEQDMAYSAIYQEVCSGNIGIMTGPEMETAYARHWSRVDKAK